MLTGVWLYGLGSDVIQEARDEGGHSIVDSEGNGAVWQVLRDSGFRYVYPCFQYRIEGSTFLLTVLSFGSFRFPKSLQFGGGKHWGVFNLPGV